MRAASGSGVRVVGLVTEQGLQPLGGVVVGGVEAPTFAVAVERGELLLEVALEAGAVLALERAEVLHLTVELVLLLLEVAEQLLAPLGGLGVEHLRAGAGVGLERVGLDLALGLEPLRLGAGLTDDLVGLVLRLAHQL